MKAPAFPERIRAVSTHESFLFPMNVLQISPLDFFELLWAQCSTPMIWLSESLKPALSAALYIPGMLNNLYLFLCIFHWIVNSMRSGQCLLHYFRFHLKCQFSNCSICTKFSARWVLLKLVFKGNSLVVQWLGLEGLGLIPGWGTKIPQASQHGQKFFFNFLN